MDKLPDYGVINIGSYQSFLKKSKIHFNQHQQQTSFTQNDILSDYTIKQYVGKGSFANVYLVQNNSNGTHHAMKVISKEWVLKKSQINCVKNEKMILSFVNFPLIIRLEHLFMDNSFIYYIMPFIVGGDMFFHLRKANRFDEHLTRFYSAQVVLGLEYLHFLDIVYRDLKPENILIDHTGYLKITDFGFAKVVKHRTFSICGTPEYTAPEIIAGKGYGKAVDWWSLGVLLFEMASGNVPFHHRDDMKLFVLAASLRYNMPQHFSSELKDLIKNILQSDQSRSLGNLRNDAKDIKGHKWFRPIIWINVLNRVMKPPFIPAEGSLIRIEKCQENLVLNIEPVNRSQIEFQDF